MLDATTTPAEPADLALETGPVRYLLLDGTVSEPCLIVDTTLRNGRVVVSPEGSTKRITVHRRRLLPLTAQDTAQALSVGDKFSAFCPKCGSSMEIQPGAEEAECAEHGMYHIHWMGAKSMAVDETTAKPKKAKSKTKPAAKAKTAVKAATPKDSPAAVDLGSIAALGELYQKTDAAFNHPNVQIAVYTLLTEAGRKHCFNTYNGNFGRRTKDAATEMETFRKPNKGFQVKDLGKERAKLQKSGYVLVSPGKKTAARATAPAEPAPAEPAQAEPAAATAEPETATNGSPTA